MSSDRISSSGCSIASNNRFMTTLLQWRLLLIRLPWNLDHLQGAIHARPRFNVHLVLQTCPHLSSLIDSDHIQKEE